MRKNTTTNQKQNGNGPESWKAWTQSIAKWSIRVVIIALIKHFFM